MPGRGGAFGRLYRGETSFDFAGRWRRWFALSATVIIVGLLSVGLRGVNFSIDFKGGTVWQVPSHQSVPVVRAAVDKVDPTLSQGTVQVLTNRATGQRIIEVAGKARTTSSANAVKDVGLAMARVSHVPFNDVVINAIGPSWGANVTDDAIKAVLIFLVAVSVYIWFRFEGKMALAALTALVHDILVTVGVYSLSGLQVSPDTVIAFLTTLGYSLYDTIVVFDKVQENTRGLASTNRITYTETVNVSMNQVLARSLNTSFVAIIPIVSILVIGAGLLGATALSEFGLALAIGLTTGAYSSIFIASPLLALLKEREPRYAELRKRLGAGRPRRISPRSAASGGVLPEPGTPRRPSGSRAPAGRPAASPVGAARRSADVQVPEGAPEGSDPTGGPSLQPASAGNGSSAGKRSGLARPSRRPAPPQRRTSATPSPAGAGDPAASRKSVPVATAASAAAGTTAATAAAGTTAATAATGTTAAGPDGAAADGSATEASGGNGSRTNASGAVQPATATEVAPQRPATPVPPRSGAARNPRPRKKKRH